MLKVTPLGGLGEIGLNMLAVEYEGHILVIDAGLMFPEDYMPGVDMVIPDTQYLKERKESVRGIVLTHGHEDHIGAMPFFLKDFNIPVFGTSFTLELLKEKLKEHDLADKVILNKIKSGDKTHFGPFQVEYIRVNHSIVDGVGLAITTPEGVLIHSGDFKIDRKPVKGQDTDLARFAAYGKKRVLALFSDSTNIEKEGFSLSEREVLKTLNRIFKNSRGRLILAAFASNIARIQEVINLAVKYGRRVTFSGKSMKTNVRIARELGFLHYPPKVEVSEEGVRRLPDEQVVLITTGSQGEPMSSLARIAQDKHKDVKIKEGDTIILSSRFIPGNEKAITAIINSLYRMGAEVIYEKVSAIHSSGHAYAKELQQMIRLVKPKYFVPIHGEYRHLVKHAQLARKTGLPAEHTFVLENGKGLWFEDGTAFPAEPVATGRVLVDGKGIGDVGELVLRDRRRLSGDGLVIAILVVDEQTHEILYGPDLISRGFVFEDQGGYILDEAKQIILTMIAEMEQDSPMDWNATGVEMKKRLKKYFDKIIERRPLILPVIIPF
ncbi:MAG: ribonuclease J [Desulfobacteraceae bacterium]|nr:MAG: ribonuclease J [Desulfobacteraceae bacterium]